MNTDAPRVHMTGSEWFATRPGGLNRYFQSLFQALQQHTDIELSASAFGEPPAGGASWGRSDVPLARRIMMSRQNPTAKSNIIIDRHFSLYGSRPRRPFNTKSPLVVHFHGPWAAESDASGETQLMVRAKKAFERIRYSSADKFVVLSTSFKNVLCEQYGVDETKVIIIPPGVDLERFRIGPAAPTRRRVLCVRRLERRMGIDILLKAWQTVSQRHGDVELVIVGTGTEERNLRQLADQLHLDRNVRFAERVSDEHLAKLYSESLVTVVPTLELEGFGLIALESLAAGRAPIVTDCGGLPDSVKGLDGSLIVPANDTDALAERLILAVEGQIPSPAECRRHAEQFTWEKAARKHYELYRSMSLN